MTKLEELIFRAPELCGASGVNAERWGKMYLDTFKAEKADHESAFASVDGESVESRLNVLQGLYMCHGVNSAAVGFLIGLITVRAYTDAIVRKGRTDLIKERDSLAEDLAKQEPSYHEISEVMSVNEAVTAQGQWA